MDRGGEEKKETKERSGMNTIAGASRRRAVIASVWKTCSSLSLSGKKSLEVLSCPTL